jgi:Spy/CpxP family protein refolding chaperone
MMLRKHLPAALGVLFALGVVGFGQEPQPQTPAPDALRREGIERSERQRQREIRREGMRERGMGRQHIERFAQELKLTEEQRQQRRAIMQRRLEGLKGQREELFRLREKRIDGTFNDADAARARALHEEIRAAMEGTRAEMNGVLTAEQKAQLEQLKQERKLRMQDRLKMREERLRLRQDRLNREL